MTSIHELIEDVKSDYRIYERHPSKTTLNEISQRIQEIMNRCDHKLRAKLGDAVEAFAAEIIDLINGD